MKTLLIALILLLIAYYLGIVNFSGITVCFISTTLPTGFFIAFTEEMFYRGYLQARIGALLYHDGVRRAIIAGIIFGLMHVVNYVNPLLHTYIVNYRLVMSITGGCAAGVILGCLREVYGDILAPTFLHGALDAMLWVIGKASTTLLTYIYAGAVIAYFSIELMKRRWGKAVRSKVPEIPKA